MTTATDAPTTGHVRVHEDWSFEYDLGDELHCSLHRCFEEAPEYIRQLITDHLNTVGNPQYLDSPDDLDAIRDTVNHLIEAYQDEEGTTEDPATPAPEGSAPADVLTALLDIQGELAPHGYCQCGLDAWNGMDEDCINEILDQLFPDAAYWVLSTNAEDFTDPDRIAVADLSVSEIWNTLNTRNGWSEIQMSWTAETRILEVAYGSSPSTWWAQLTPLTKDEADIMDAFDHGGFFYDPPDVLGMIRQDPEAARAVADLIDAITTHGDFPCELGDAFTLAKGLSEAELDLVEQLATDQDHDWDGTLADLIILAKGCMEPVAV